jgi:uncharacterized protein (DUF1501 family)
MPVHPIPRRDFLSFAALGAGAILVSPHMALASVGTERRFVFVIQRGAADGLDIVVPTADPGYAARRGAFAIDPAKTAKLDGSFGLHPAMTEIAAMYGRHDALFVHAVASPYRDRSHFDGQNVLETGGAQPYQLKDGWLNRLVGMLPRTHDEAIALAPTVPLALRGAADVTSYAPSVLPDPSGDLMTRVGQLYAADTQLHPLWSAALEAKGLAGTDATRQDPASIGRLAAGFLVKPNGPRIAMIETGGWDTHSAQAQRLGAQLRGLDTMLAALRAGLGPVWNQTTVLVATEFGRTAAANGTGGTDHGTGSVAMVLGGAIRGGRVVADWPGLGAPQLYEGRDLAPTAHLDALLAGVAGESLGLDPAHVARTLFADRAVRPMTGLVTA